MDCFDVISYDKKLKLKKNKLLYDITILSTKHKIYTQMKEKRIMDKEIMDFIIDTFDSNVFKRMVESLGQESCGYDENEYDKFITHNRKCVNELTINDCVFVMTVIDKIKNRVLMQCSRETFMDWESNGLYFNMDNQLVISHPQ